MSKEDEKKRFAELKKIKPPSRRFFFISTSKEMKNGRTYRKPKIEVKEEN